MVGIQIVTVTLGKSVEIRSCFEDRADRIYCSRITPRRLGLGMYGLLWRWGRFDNMKLSLVAEV